MIKNSVKILSLALIYIDGEVNKAMEGTEGWYVCDPTSSWNSPVQYDLEGNLKIDVLEKGPEAYDLYYNGEYFLTLDRNIRTVKKEKLYTNDGKEWNVKWMGSDVVEYIKDDETIKIINHYQEKEYTFTNQYISESKAKKILKELFPYADFDFEIEDDTVWFRQYVANTKKETSSMTMDKYLDKNKNSHQFNWWLFNL